MYSFLTVASTTEYSSLNNSFFIFFRAGILLVLPVIRSNFSARLFALANNCFEVLVAWKCRETGPLVEVSVTPGSKVASISSSTNRYLEILFESARSIRWLSKRRVYDNRRVPTARGCKDYLRDREQRTKDEQLFIRGFATALGPRDTEWSPSCDLFRKSPLVPKATFFLCLLINVRRKCPLVTSHACIFIPSRPRSDTNRDNDSSSEIRNNATNLSGIPRNRLYRIVIDPVDQRSGLVNLFEWLK